MREAVGVRLHHAHSPAVGCCHQGEVVPVLEVQQVVQGTDRIHGGATIFPQELCRDELDPALADAHHTYAVVANASNGAGHVTAASRGAGQQQG